MDTELAPLLVSVYAFLAGLLIGWSTPRGRYLKNIQLAVLIRLKKFYE